MLTAARGGGRGRHHRGQWTDPPLALLLTVDGEVGNEEPEHEIRYVDRLPGEAGEDDHPRKDHARARRGFAEGRAKGKQHHAAAELDGDGPRLRQVSRLHPDIQVMDVAERVALVPDIAQDVDELVEERVHVDLAVPHAVVQLEAKHGKCHEDGNRRAPVESGEAPEGRRRQRVEQVALVLLVHAQQQVVAQGVPGDDEEYSHHPSPAEHGADERHEAPICRVRRWVDVHKEHKHRCITPECIKIRR